MDLRLKEVAANYGITLNSIAGELGIHRSNMSAIASGARGVSLKSLIAICRYLNCSLDEIVCPETPRQVFKDTQAEARLDLIQDQNYDGIDKSWVNKLMMAQKSHYRKAGRSVK